MQNRRLMSAMVIVIAGSLVALPVGRLGACHKSDANASGRITEDQMIRKSEPLLTALSPGSKNLYLTVIHGSSGHRSGVDSNYWLVDGLDTAKHMQVHLTWDADTGELITASHSNSEFVREPSAVMPRSEAVRQTGSWLTTLGYFDSEPDLQPMPGGDHTPYVWRVEWRGSHRKVAVSISTASGDLIMAQMVSPTGAPPGPGTSQPRSSALARL